MGEIPNNRNITLPIQREVRKRCGYGCVICGDPLYDYDHMKGWANVHEHVADDITLLCDKHHREVTSGLLPRSKVNAANSAPFNLTQGRSSSLYLHYEGSMCTSILGGNTFETKIKSENSYSEMIPIMVDGIPLVAFILQDNQLLLNVNWFDEYNNSILRIVNNQLYYSTSPWDIEFVAKVLTIREKTRKFLLQITFEPPNKITINKGRFLYNGVEILINDEYLLITNNNILISGCSEIDCRGGLIIGQPSPISGFMSIQSVNRYLGDSKKSMEWKKEIFGTFN